MNRTSFFLGILIFLMGSMPVFSQIEQRRRARERMDRSIRASEERDRRDTETEAALPVPKAARMNVDVQSVLAAKEYKTFAEAKANALGRVADGDPIWLYLKFSGRLGDYVVTTRDVEDPSILRYTLYTEIGPKGDITALSQYPLRFAKEDLAATEFKIALAPAVIGRNRSMPTFLRAVSAAKPGQWNSEVRVSNLAGFPRGVSDHLATSGVVLDLKGGNAKYRKMDAEYDAIMLRGSTDLSIVPRAGTFFDAAVKAAVTSRLQAEGIMPAELYFAGDAWADEIGSPPSAAPSRRVFAVFTYRKGENCFYGLAEAMQTFDSMISKYGRTVITLTKDLGTTCAK